MTHETLQPARVARDVDRNGGRTRTGCNSHVIERKFLRKTRRAIERRMSSISNKNVEREGSLTQDVNARN